MTAGHEFYKKLTCPKAEHVVRSVDGGEAHCRSSSTGWTASSNRSWDAGKAAELLTIQTDLTTDSAADEITEAARAGFGRIRFPREQCRDRPRLNPTGQLAAPPQVLGDHAGSVATLRRRPHSRAVGARRTLSEVGSRFGADPHSDAHRRARAPAGNVPEHRSTARCLSNAQNERPWQAPIQSKPAQVGGRAQCGLHRPQFGRISAMTEGQTFCGAQSFFWISVLR
jgi:hypothetical protein